MRFTRAWAVLVIALAGSGLMACQPPEPEGPIETPTETPATEPVETGVVEVTLEDYSFLAPPRLRSGWTTFRMTNNGEQPHFMLFWRLPEGKTFDEYAAEVSQPFQQEFDRFYAGELRLFDRIRLLTGKPPVPLGRALRCVREARGASPPGGRSTGLESAQSSDRNRPRCGPSC